MNLKFRGLRLPDRDIGTTSSRVDYNFRLNVIPANKFPHAVVGTVKVSVAEPGKAVSERQQKLKEKSLVITEKSLQGWVTAAATSPLVPGPGS